MLLVKVGGGASINWEAICQDLKIILPEEDLILIHGANFLRDKIAARLGVKVKTVISPSGVSSVYTDLPLLEVMLMTYAGLVNKKVVALLNKNCIKAVGLSGIDGGLWLARAKKEILVRDNNRTFLLKDNLTGRVEEINTELINLLLENKYLPVICSPALSFEGEIVNVDNDWAVAIMAKFLKAERIIFLLDKPGLLRTPEDEQSLISHVSRDEFENILANTGGRMKKKLMSVKEALEAGTKKVILADGRTEQPLISALQSKGTIFS